MIVLLSLALFLLSPFSPSVLEKASEVSHIFQQKCLQALPASSPSRSTLASLVCGEKIMASELKKNLQRTSLIHIFVVSGSHLLLLEAALAAVGVPFWVRFVFLSIYTFMVGFQPPAVRALLAMILRRALKFQNLHFAPDFVTLFAGLLALALFPAWWTSLSLQMSWCAGLALSLPSIFRIRGSIARLLFSQCGIFLLMIAPLWGLGSLHPLSIVYNILLAPIVSFVLLPLGFLSLLHPLFLSLFSTLMSWFATSLQVLAEPIEIAQHPLPSTPFLWGWIFILQMSFHFLRIHLRQGRHT